MHSKPTLVACLALGAFLFTGAALAQDFTRSSLLKRFDADKDGRFSAPELATLRASFGIDVPLLPARAYRYTKLPRLAHVAGKTWEQLDNTPPDNRLTDAGATLGRVLFYDRQLSRNNTIACASCHLQERAFADPRRYSVGFEKGETGRNAMSLANLRYSNIRGGRPGFFWDERAATLEAQVLMPIQDKVEMGMTLVEVEQRLRKLPYYRSLFAAAFGSPEINSKGISKAVAQFMRAMTSFDSRYDRAAELAGGDHSKPFADFTEEENLGKSLFIDGVDRVAEIGCAHCHVPPTFGMPKSFNNGLDRKYADRGLGARNVPSNDPFTPSNDGKFKAPSLRNIELTGPYMHDGRFKTLDEVMEHYSTGIHDHPNVGLAFNGRGGDNKGTSGFHMTKRQKSALIKFLKTLTDKKFISDPRFSDPFVRSRP